MQVGFCFKQVGIVVIAIGLFFGCSEDQMSAPKETAAPPKPAPQSPKSPMGSWLMYGGSDTGIRTKEEMGAEMTILTLRDSTYSLTMMQPETQIHITEQGTVEYILDRNGMKFTVFSATGVDFSGGEPRKLTDVNEVVPWDRPPGTVYWMDWNITDEYMALASDGHETSYFVVLKNDDLGPIDLQPGQSDKP